MNKKLYFTNPEFRYDEINVTVRLGDKWAGMGLFGEGLCPGEFVELVETGTEASYGTAVWAGCLLATVGELAIAEDLLKLEHDESCQSFEGLVAELCQVYELDVLDTDDLVTVCFFIPTGYTPGETENKAA